MEKYRLAAIFTGATLLWLGGAYLLDAVDGSALFAALIFAAIVTAFIGGYRHWAQQQDRKVQLVSKGLLISVALGALILGYTQLSGYKLNADLISRPNPAANYNEALQRLDALQARDGDDIRDDCRSTALLHGARTETSIVLLHGLSNCPRQFAVLGQQLHQLGYNVIIPRYPTHGEKDRLTDSTADLTAEILSAVGDEAVDIAHGLGDEVTVVGFSAGGAVAAWLMQQRAGLNRIVLISPAVGLAAVPAKQTANFARLLLSQPNFFMWWDPVAKADREPPHAYPRFASHALGEILRLGQIPLTLSQKEQPVNDTVVLVSNENDFAVNRGLNEDLVAKWAANGAEATTYTFPFEQFLPHDLIDPDEPGSQIDAVYPTLIQLITGN